MSVDEMAASVYPDLQPAEAKELVSHGLHLLKEKELITTEKVYRTGRRDFLATMTKVAAVPILLTALTGSPANADSLICAGTYTGSPGGTATGSPAAVGVAGSVSSSLCLTAGQTVTMTANTGVGLEFDETFELMVTGPSGTMTGRFSSFQNCEIGTNTQTDAGPPYSDGTINVTAGTATLDITNLFAPLPMGAQCFSYTMVGEQCNSNGRWLIGGFDFVVA